MWRYLHYGLILLSTLAWTATAQAVSADTNASAAVIPKHASDLPSAYIVLAGVVLISVLDWVYVQAKKRRAYRRLGRVVALERAFHSKSHRRC